MSLRLTPLLRTLREDVGARANAWGLTVNVGLAIAKLIVGALSGSAALMADAFNSVGDIVATSIAAVGYAWGQRPPDDNHPYGHGNIESVAGLIVGAALLATGVFIGVDGLLALLSGPREAPGALAMAMALVTMIVKEALFRHVEGVGRRLNSPALLASARDHRADVFVGLAVFMGVAGARLGLPWLDPLVALAIGLAIVWMSLAPLRHNVGVLLDEVDPAFTRRVHEVAEGAEGVQAVARVRVHPLGSYYMVDLEIMVDGALSLVEAHRLAHAVEARVCQEVEHVREVRVHVNPA